MDKPALELKRNHGYKYLMNVIDIIPKQADSVPFKSKSLQEIVDVFEGLFVNKKPKVRWADQATQLTYAAFKKFLDGDNIKLHHVFSEGKDCTV